MGRKAKKGLNYFPLDVDFFQDIKVRRLIKKHGGKAASVYIFLLCTIYKEGYYVEWNQDLTFIISVQLECEESYVQDVLKSCVSLGLFDKCLFNAEKVYTSAGIQERYARICRDARRRVDVGAYWVISSVEMPISSAEMPISSAEMPISSAKSTQRKEKVMSNAITKETSPIGEAKKARKSGALPIGELQLELSADVAWLEVVVMSIHQRGFPGETVEGARAWLTRFFLKLAADGETHKHPSDAKRHFSNWWRRELELEVERLKKQSTHGTSYPTADPAGVERKRAIARRAAEAQAEFLAKEQAERGRSSSD